MKEWTETTLGQLCDDGGGEIKTGPFGSQLHQSDYSSDGTPVVMPKDILDGRLSEFRVARVGSEHVQRLAQHQLQSGDIVYGRRGDIGRCALITERETGWLCGTGCLRISLGEGAIEPKFLFYFLINPATVSWIYNQAVGATMPNLNTGILRSITVRYPDILTQRRIAGILSTYDDLIEINQRRIAILEDIARRLFDEWFVRFRYPGHEAVPLVETEWGMVPEGWDIIRAEEIIDFDPRTKVPKEGTKHFVPMGSLATASSVISNWETRSGNSGSKFQNGDTLFARITPCLENGKTGLVNFLEVGETAFGSTEFTVMRGKGVSSSFVYLLARSEAFRATAIKSMGGADGRQRVRTEALKSFELARPTTGILTDFMAVTEPMLAQVRVLADQNDRLRAARDLLLPKLISGEIDVTDAEETFAEAAE